MISERRAAMLKSTFSKYLLTFVIIIIVSFLVLSGIITSMIDSYFSEEKEERLVTTTDVIAKTIENQLNPEVDRPGYLDFISDMMIKSVINNDPDIEIIITSGKGNVILSTVGVMPDSDGLRNAYTDATGNLGTVNTSLFQESKYSGNDTAMIYHGNLGGYLKTQSIACRCEIVIDGEVCGYVISAYSTAEEDAFIITTRRAITSSAAWVMIAAVIAVYFITQRIISPLRNMTAAAKKFGKGDFSTRVPVYGSDEVSELSVAFNNMADSLEKLEKMRSSFLASVSHDLRTPMTTIAGFIDGIVSGAIPPEKQEYYLGIISSEVHRLSRLVSQLLDVSRLESGDRKMRFEVFDVAEVARIILLSFEQKIDDKHLEVEFEADEDEMLVSADKDAIHQVVYNLCHNAIKFANDGGKFSIKITSLDQKHLVISVYDEGQVISDEDKKMVFERFYKTDSSRGLDKNGVGLGLYICKTIIDAHDEKIGVRSDERGTEFYFTLKKGK